MSGGCLSRPEDLVGDSESMAALRREIAAVAPLRSTVLVTGETGVGKGVVARALHRQSSQRAGPFVHVDCAALSPHLVESEIFGHERGAFTGAVSRRVGRFEQAARGTIFLDEIGDLAPPLQAKLLRVLQDREFERLGGDRTLAMTARVVAATARDLGAAVREGGFRADLYFRINVVGLTVPPLRERPADVRSLLEASFARLAGELCLAPPRLSEAAYTRLARYDWPGNVRELLNASERLMIRNAGEVVDDGHLDGILDDVRSEGRPPRSANGFRSDGVMSVTDPVALIASELQATGGNVARTARRLGLPRSTLRHWIRRHDIR